jgi:hypothetical protein
MASKAQARKEEIIQALVKTRQTILDKVSTLSKAERECVFLGTWSIKDLLAHMAGWDFTNLDAVGSVLAGRIPAFYDYRDRDWQTYNAILVEKYKKNSFRELLATVKNSQRKLIKFLQSIPPEDFNKDYGVRFRGYKVTIQRLLEAEEKDEQIHYGQIVNFFKATK